MIRSEADIAEALDELLRLDPRLAAIAATAGPLPLRRLPAGLRGLLRTLMGQQVSIASADAIFARFASLVDLDDPHAILAAPEETFRAAGLSRAKQQTALAVAEANAETPQETADALVAAAMTADTEAVSEAAETETGTGSVVDREAEVDADEDSTEPRQAG